MNVIDQLQYSSVSLGLNSTYYSLDVAMSEERSLYWVGAKQKKLPPLETPNLVVAPATGRSKKWAVSACKQVMFL
jgi:hypothetical protein